jgi:hypothetical protein
MSWILVETSSPRWKIRTLEIKGPVAQLDRATAF